jgi:hypothetical protein
MGASRFRAMAVALFLAALAALILSVGAGAVNSQKPYSIVICGPAQTVPAPGTNPPILKPTCTSANPAVIAPGGTTDNPSHLSVMFTNDNKPGSGIQLGSDNLDVPNPPTGFSIIANAATPQPTIATLSPNSQPQTLPQCPSSFNNSAPPCFVLLNNGARIGFRNLNLVPGESAIISNLSALTPQPSTTTCTTASHCSWTDEAKQSNDFSGTGNDLNSDPNSSKDTVMSDVASCPKNNGCSTKLGNGGTGTSAPGSISTTVDTSSGKTTVTQIESIDLGGPQTLNCSGLSSPHLTSLNLSGGTNNGSDRSQTITITTTHFADYEAEACFETAVPFTQAMVDANGHTVALIPATLTTLPDNTKVYQGLLPDCGNQALQVNCNKNPGVASRQTTFASDGTTPLTHTLVAQIPPGFDSRIGN